MTTGIYVRVSSPKGQKTDSQKAELEAWLKRHRHKAVQWFEYRDSATNMQRDAFQKLQAAIFAGKITTVVVWKLTASPAISRKASMCWPTGASAGCG
jgi:DNA invertase Pin-like site-specific DNA recombinase